MYEDWTEIDLTAARRSVLRKFSEGTAKRVASSLVKEMAKSTMASSASDPDPGIKAADLTTDEDVQWGMQV